MLVAMSVLVLTFAAPAFGADKTKWMDLKREGQRLEMAGNHKAAERYYKLCLEVARGFPKNCSERIETLYHVTNIYVQQDKYWDAEVFYKRLITLVEEQKANGSLDHEALVWMEDLADAYSTHVKGWLEWMALEHAVKLRDIISGDNNKYMATTLRKLVTVLMTENKYREAEPYAERLSRLTSNLKGPQELIKASDLFLLSLVQFHIGRYTKAEANVREAMALYMKLEKPPGFCTANCLMHLAKVLKCQNQLELAEQTANRALKIIERTNAKNFILNVHIHDLLGELDTRRGKYSDAVREYEQVISISETQWGPNTPALLPALGNLKAAYLKVHNSSKAREAERRIASISKQIPQKKPAGQNK